MTDIEVSYTVTTPMFCSGAHPKENEPEFRLASFKGVLRYWWRALAWSRFDGDLDRIKREEDSLFGSAAGGQSRVLMRLAAPKASTVLHKDTVLTTQPGNDTVVGEGVRYLGYGVMEAFASRPKGTQAGQLTRACLAAPITVTIKLRCRGLTTDQRDLLRDAIRILGLIGGMGAKSRKGFGSLCLVGLRIDGEGDSIPRTPLELRNAILSFHSATRSGMAPYTAFSTGTRHVLLAGGDILALELLDLVGREMVRYRSLGSGGRILGGDVATERNFFPDHQLMKSHVSSRTTHPRRIVFGLPHNYGNHAEEKVGPADMTLDRRSSPLFIHIHQTDNGPVAVVSFFPAQFLPTGKTDISVGGKRIPQAPEGTLYQVIEDFLDRLLNPRVANEAPDPRKRQEKFAGHAKVPP